MVLIFKAEPGKDETHYCARALAIRNSVAKRITDLQSFSILLSDLCSWQRFQPTPRRMFQSRFNVRRLVTHMEHFLRHTTII